MDDDSEILARQGGKLSVLTPCRAVGRTPAVVLINPKYAHNVGTVLRACSCYGIGQLWYTGNRVDLAAPNRDRTIRRTASLKPRLPREERMKGYGDVVVHQYERPFDMFVDAVPVAVELLPNCEHLPTFEHPANAVYVFGPEDGSVPGKVLQHCHRFVAIPARHCLNLAATVYTVLYDRQTKLAPGLTLRDALLEFRGRA
jgi:tRNA(Leu) C34 or U34 (ribose-2'-O)-methylase TrmL